MPRRSRSRRSGRSWLGAICLLLTSYGCCSTGSPPDRLLPPASRPEPLVLDPSQWSVPQDESGKIELPYKEFRAILRAANEWKAYAEAWEVGHGR